MPRVCVFDVNETVLDLGALDPHFERIFGDTSARQGWFGHFLALWTTLTIIGDYRDFGTVGGSALEMGAERQGVDLSDEDKQQTHSLRPPLLYPPPLYVAPRSSIRRDEAGV